MKEKVYLCIDLKSFYASVEAVERGLNPFTTNLVVADSSRGRGAICLAITPALKALGIQNRCRLFEIPSHIDYITAMPRMKRYIEYSAEIYAIYLRFVAKEDILVYSIDECFFDVTPYLQLYGKTPRELACMMRETVLAETGICASVGIGTNLFLAKVALDITAKQAADHIGFLDETRFQSTLWHHTPITDFWNIGPGIARRLSRYGIYDLWGVSHTNPQWLRREFGVNAQYLLDHAWGQEPCTIAEIHAYTPESTSISSGQILFENYDFDHALLVLKEMVTELSLELLERGMQTDSIALSVGFARRELPPCGSSRRLDGYTDSCRKLTSSFVSLFSETVRRDEAIRRLTVSFNRLAAGDFVNYDMFSDYAADEKERKKQTAILELKKRFGKNAVLRGMNLEEKATGMIRNKLIGGHNGDI
ncbi:MAG: DNA repair protein [Ruminococcaceae bacterium]|nr:DNA repair protein [Oscillospiraceae bacterium]